MKEKDFTIQKDVLINVNDTDDTIIYSVTQGRIGSDAFRNREDITAVVIPEGITEIYKQAFRGCKNLKKVVFPTTLQRIEDHAFAECTQLSSINIPSPRVKLSIGAFKGCTSLMDQNGFIIVNNTLFEYAGKEAAVSVPASVTHISGFAFYKNHNLRSITIPETVQEIDIEAFEKCDNLSSVTLPSTLTNIGGRAFKGCKKLVNKDGFIIINGILFDYLGEETNVIIPHGITSISDTAFSNTLIKKATIPESVKSIGQWAFMDCINLKSIHLPDSITQIDVCAFENCKNMTSIHISNNLEKIGNYAFGNCTKLKKMYLPSSITYLGRDVFEDCNRLVITTPAGSYAETYLIDHNIFNYILV